MLKMNGSLFRACLPMIAAVFLLLGTFQAVSFSSQAAHLDQEQLDVEGEASLSHRILLPMAVNRFITIDIRVVGTADASGDETRGFQSGESLFFSLSGKNQSTLSATADINWTQEGPCMPEQSIYQGPLEMAPGNWSFWQVGTAPECLGVYTHTLIYNFQGITSTIKTNYAVLHPSLNLVDSIHAFDKCNAPSLSQLRAWWKDSPYRAVNLYMGGISRYCDNAHLDAVWIYEASQMGWTFIPTWVGPQAPCTNYKYQMSRDAATAYQQGRSEARAATSAARRLGLLQERLIYYDVESYRYKITGCSEDTVRKAVSEFMRGWTEQLHELGLLSGAYGSPTGCFMTDWDKLGMARPDHVWFTHWYTDTFDPEATVWYTQTASFNLPDYLWPNRQRIKQYTNSHYETWGGVTFGIDSNVVDGGMTGVYDPNALPVASGATDPDLNFQYESSEMEAGPQITSAGPVQPGVGWAVAPGGLLWTQDAGQTWQAKTPPQSQGRPLDAVFWDDGRGLYLAQSEGLETWRTADGGQTWEAFILPASGDFIHQEIAGGRLGSSGAQHAWIVLKEKTGSNWSIGSLFVTFNGGATWEPRPIPVSGQVYFENAGLGWLVGGPEENEIYLTRDGGLSWHRQAGLSWQSQAGLSWQSQADESSAGQSGLLTLLLLVGDGARLAGSLPENAIRLEWASEQIGWVTTQDGSCSGYKTRAGETPPPGAEPLRCSQVTRLWQTLDGGLTWAEISLSNLEFGR